MMDDLISRQAALKAVSFDTEAYMAINMLSSAQPEPFTDEEQRIFLSAMERHEHVCKHVDAVYGDSYEDGLLRICHNIVRKVKGALWT